MLVGSKFKLSLLQICSVCLFILKSAIGFADIDLNLHQNKLFPVDGQANDFFSEAIAASHNNTIIGSETKDGTGAAYIFNRNQFGHNQWGQVAKLTASDLGQGKQFASSVDIDQNIAVIGAIGDSQRGNNAGAAYVFYLQEGKWVEVSKLLGSDTTSNDRFGFSVSVSDDTIAVGAYKHAGNGFQNSGAVYLFGRNVGGPDQWGEITKLTDPLNAENDHFGAGVAIFGDTLAIGAENKDAVSIASQIYPVNYQPQPRFTFTKQDEGFCGIDSGAVFIFYRHHGGTDSWGQLTQFSNSLAECADHFGRYIKIDNDTLAVGIPFKDIFDTLFAGMVFLYTRDQEGVDFWGESQILQASDTNTGDQFGIGFDIQGDTIVVGAENEDTQAFNAGSAYVFSRNEQNTWQESNRLFALDGEKLDRMGRQVALADGAVIISASHQNSSGPKSGSAYVFQNEALPAVSASYSLADSILTINAVEVENAGIFQATLSQTMPGQMSFRVDQLTPIDTVDSAIAKYYFDKQILHIPSVVVDFGNGVIETYTVDLHLPNYNQPFVFDLQQLR